MNDEKRIIALENLADAFIKIGDTLKARGIELPEDIELSIIKQAQLRAIKRRDRNEPGRTRKELMQEKLGNLVKRLFKRQHDRFGEMLNWRYPDRKALNQDYELDTVFSGDDDLRADLIKLLIRAVQDGIALFGEETDIQIDYTLVNSKAAEWARKHTYDFVKGIDDITRPTLQKAISLFVKTPGMTIGDVMDQISPTFGEGRALLISTTEITRTYAQSNQLAGEALKEELGDVRVIKTWFTNNDTWTDDSGRRRGVCEICAGMDGQEVEIDEPFIHPETKQEFDGPPEPHPGCRCWTDVSTEI